MQDVALHVAYIDPVSVTHIAELPLSSSVAAVCAVRTPLGIDWKILFIRREPMLSGFLSPNA